MSMLRSKTTATGKWGTAIALTFLTAVTLVAYSNSFTDRFAGADAKESIRDNPHIRTLWPLSEAMSLPLLETTVAADADAKGGTVVRRPMLSLSFALTHALFGPKPWGFHATNLAIHLAAGWLLFGLLRRTLHGFADGDLLPDSLGSFQGADHGEQSETRARTITVLASAVSALWLVHPLQTESVTNLVQRAESQMGLLYLATLYCAARGFLTRAAEDSQVETRPLKTPSHRATGWFLASGTACALGMATKETMVTAPVLVLLYDRTFVSATFANALRKHRGLHLGLFATWLVLIALIVLTFGDVRADFEESNTLAYLLAQPGVLCHYLRLVFWPWPLHVYVSTEVFDVAGLHGVALLGSVVLPGLIVLGLLAATGLGLRRRSPLGFAGAWFFLILAPTSSVVATSDVIQEHRVYLSLAAVITVGALTVYKLLTSLPSARRQLGVWGAVGGFVGVLVILSALTLTRNRDYHFEFAMIHPADLQEQYMILAQHYRHRDLVDRATVEAWDVVHDPAADRRERVFSLFFLGLSEGEAGEFEPAATNLTAAIKLEPNFAYAHRELASVLRRQGKLEDGDRHARRALELKPMFPEAELELGMILAEADRFTEARSHFTRALGLRANYADALFELGVLEQRTGNHAAAKAAYIESLRIDPDFEEARARLDALNTPRAH